MNKKYQTNPSLYIWTIPVSDGHLINYIGETGKSIRKRSMEHLQCQYNGQYNAYDPAELKKGTRVCLWEGYHWRKKERSEKITQFYKNFEKNSKAIINYIRECKIFMASLNADARLRKRIESAIIKGIIANNDFAGSLQNPPQRTTERNNDEKPVILNITSDKRILGLKQTLEA